MLTHRFDTIILGAGAAGFLCAIEAGRRHRRVALLEHADSPGQKILISGGGRCNFTHLHCRPENFLSANPHFAKSALARYTPADFVALVEKHRIAYHEKTRGQLFCDGSAREILDMLLAESKAAEVQLFAHSKIREVSRTTEFVLRAEVRGAPTEFHAPTLVVATGGLSIPKIGATSFGYDLARQFSLSIIETRPALVPFVLSPEDRDNYCDLTGLSTEISVQTGHQAFRDKMLITHRGLSGPAMLQVSSYWRPGEAIHIDLAPGQEAFGQLRDPKIPRSLTAAKSALQRHLPHRLAHRWLDLHEPKSWTNAALTSLEQALHHWPLTPAGTEGYAKAEVTAGGIDTNELSAKTLESQNVPGLFFIGEVVDVTGHLGGFNFQWAWSSGAAAGRAV